MKNRAIENHLKNLVSGEVLFDDVSREVYSTAACLYRIKPMGVVRPRNSEEVSRIVKFCAQEEIPVIARGAGSGAAGQAIGEGLVIDLTRFMNRIIKIDPENAVAHVEPGLIFSRLNSAAKEFNLHLPPDPSSGSYATIGGMIANNSSGAHSIKYGSMRRYVPEMEVVLSDGTMSRFSEQDISSVKPKGTLERKIYKDTVSLLRLNADLIERYRPRVKNSSGYLVWDVLVDNRVDFTKLLTGSEGTLAIVTSARLRLLPLPRVRQGSLFFFNDLEKAGEAIAIIRRFSPSALEIMDRQFVTLVREHRPELREILPENLNCMLLVEFEAGSFEEAQAPLKEVESRLVHETGLAFGFRVARDEKELERLWEVRKAASPILYRQKGPDRMTRFVEDIVIPPDRLTQGLSKVQEILSDFGTAAPILGHAGDGNLHLNPRLDLEKPEDRKRMQDIAEEIYKVVLELKGSISGEHGDGILRAPYVRRQFGELYDVFKEIKNIFDPQNILNPGKIFSDEERVPVKDLKFSPPEKSPEHPFSAGQWDDPYRRELMLACHGCGMCRTYCPAFLADQREEFLPRSRVSLVRALARGDLDVLQNLESGDMDSILDTCYSCQRCLWQCQTGVEVARIAQAARAERKDKKGFSVRDYSMGRVEQVLKAESLIPWFERGIMDSSLLRTLLEKTTGLSKDAPLPRATLRLRKGDEGSYPAQGLATDGVKVLYYPGCLDRYASEDGSVHQIIEILKRASSGFEVPDLPCCGLPLASVDDMEAARSRARELAEKVKPYLEAGYNIVTACPGCALTFRYEYPVWIGSAGQSIAGATRSFFEFMAERIEKMEYKSSSLSHELRVAYHRPCHDSALGPEDHVLKVLEKIPGLDIHVLPSLCCGLGGVFGARKETDAISCRIGEALADAIRRSGRDLVISNCGLCRLQIERLGFKVIRPEKILAEVLLK